MTTNLPALDATTHVSSVTYACTFGLTTAPGAPVTFQVPAPVQFTFIFDTGTSQPDPAVDLTDITSDSSWFNQSTEEAAITTALDGICSLIAAMLPGITLSQIQSTVTIRRTWTITANQVGSAATVALVSSPVVYTETMAYPS
jgi:hypothetical protein